MIYIIGGYINEGYHQPEVKTVWYDTGVSA